MAVVQKVTLDMCTVFETDSLDREGKNRSTKPDGTTAFKIRLRDAHKGSPTSIRTLNMYTSTRPLQGNTRPLQGNSSVTPQAHGWAKEHIRISRYGPPQPNIMKMFLGINKDKKEVANEMKISQEELEMMLENKNEAVERWAPVFAKVTRTVQVGLLRLLNRDYSEIYSTVGTTISTKLAESKKPTRALDMFRATLTRGWDGWIQYKLDDKTVDDFLAGKCVEAERAADLLLRLANATDPTNIYGMFIR